MKVLMSRITVRDEISVILVSMDDGKVIDEFVMPLEDDHEPVLVLTGDVKEEQHD